MKLAPHRVFALAALGVMTCVSAQESNPFITVVEANEAPVKSLVLPLNSTSSLVMTPCPGCPPKSYTTTAQTQYIINGKSVTLGELRTAIAGKPDLIVTVSHRVKTGELVKITADLPTTAQKSR